MECDVLQKLEDKTTTKEQLLQTLIQNFNLLPQFVHGLYSPKARVRYGCGSILMAASVKCPEKIYPQMDVFIGLLSSPHRILVWNAMAIIANLCAVDEENKFDAVFDKYYSFTHDKYMVTVANVVGNSGKIALSKPYLIPKITEQLLSVDSILTTPHLTEECKQVIAEHAIKSFDKFFDQLDVKQKEKVLAFAKLKAYSPRKSLQKVAADFLTRWTSSKANL